jgi:hypothetical protein
MKTTIFLLALAAASVTAAEKPLRIMLITGGCCHDYKAQTEIDQAAASDLRQSGLRRGL